MQRELKMIGHGPVLVVGSAELVPAGGPRDWRSVFGTCFNATHHTDAPQQLASGCSATLLTEARIMTIRNWIKRSIAGAAAVVLSLGAGSPAAAQGKMETLNLAIAAPVAAYGPVWIALAENLFEKNGVKVNVVSTNSLTTGPAMLVSGTADVLATTAFLGLRIGIEGKSLNFIYRLINMSGRGNAFSAKPSIKSIDQIAAMGSACRVVMAPIGSASWAIYQGIAAKYNLKCSVSHVGTIPLVVAGALSGQFDAAMLNPQDAYSAQEAGKLNILLDPIKMSDELANQLYPYQHPVSAVLGMRENLTSKRDAVTRFVKALRQGDEIIAKSTPQQLADILNKKLPESFGTTPVAALALQWQIQKTIPPDGAISEREWTNLIAAAPALWGFANLDVNSPVLKYTNMVDMSFFNAAK